MHIPYDALVIGICAYSLVLSLIGCFFFVHSIRTFDKVKKMVESVILLIQKIDEEEKCK